MGCTCWIQPQENTNVPGTYQAQYELRDGSTRLTRLVQLLKNTQWLHKVSELVLLPLIGGTPNLLKCCMVDPGGPAGIQGSTYPEKLKVSMPLKAQATPQL